MGFRPAHLGSAFVDIYPAPVRGAKKRRRTPGTRCSKLNRVYGDNNNVFSVFYDPLFTMSNHAQRATAAVLPAGREPDGARTGLKIISATQTASPFAFPMGSSIALKVDLRHWEKLRPS